MSVTLKNAVVLTAFGSLEEACSQQQDRDVPPGERQDWVRVHDSPSTDEEQNLGGEQVRGGNVSTGHGRETMKCGFLKG